MGKKGYLAMRTDTDTTDLISSDLRDLGNAAKKLATHAIKLGSLGFGTTFLEWVASFAAIYLLILDRTNWKTNILTALLIPYIFFSLPSILFNFFSGQVGKWIAFIAVVLRLFFPKRFPGTHQGIWWVQKFLYTEAWHIKHHWINSSAGLSCLGSGT
ncbi:hypothetical protein PVL29_003092 [Vitis rotundifolia]|uniref:Uncharacterized protein n=1 Tax=Vitis rotundifolia TaxID=103349 RepID=A0AA39AEE3_VITRO|nr:hypothetical protein PVL29_003092 [Vitis rotundifolia]